VIAICFHQLINNLMELKKMILYQMLLLAGGLVTTLLAISALCPLPKDRPITGC
jgi:hypothetical protein